MGRWRGTTSCAAGLGLLASLLGGCTAGANPQAPYGAVAVGNVTLPVLGGCLDDSRTSADLLLDGGRLRLTPALGGAGSDVRVDLDDGSIFSGYDADVQIGSRLLSWSGRTISGDGEGMTITLERVAPPVCSADSAELKVVQGVLEVNGRIGGRLPLKLHELLNPDEGSTPLLHTVALREVLGSVDQRATFAAGRIIRAAGLDTRVTVGGVAASGGVGLWLSGTARSLAPGARLGVHSWVVDIDGVPTDGAQVDPGHPLHREFLTYYLEMGASEEFYWFVQNAAPSTGVHWMTDAEIARFGLVTE